MDDRVSALQQRVAELEELLKRKHHANLNQAAEFDNHKAAQEQLHKLMIAVEQSTSGVVITDAKGNIEYVNRKFVEITGYSSEEAKGQNPRILKSGEQGPEVYRDLWDTITAGREWRGEFHNKRKDGSLFWESAAISPIRDSSGTITSFLAIKDDITEWKKAQDELKFVHAQMIELFNSAPDAMSVINNEYTIILVNNTLGKLLGLNKEAALGRKCYDFFHNDLCHTPRCPLQRIMAGEERIETDIELKNGQNRKIPCLFTAIPYRPAGKLIGIIENFKDMTERRRAEEAMRKDFLLGSKIQREFIPLPVSNEQITIQPIYEPYNHVSGDLCDYIWVKEGQLFGYVIDVMGHGLATALQTTALRVLFRQAAEKDLLLDEKMDWINRAAIAYFAEDSFAGAICFELDFSSMTLTYVAAGINFFLASSRVLQGVVTVPGSFLGITANAEFESHTVPMRQGDAYYFVTDGIFDLMDNEVIANVSSFSGTMKALSDKATSSKRWDDATALGIEIKSKSSWPLRFTIRDRGEISHFRSRIRLLLQQLGGEKAGLLEVAVNEAVNNAIYSAEKSEQFFVHVRLNCFGRLLLVRVKDSGAGFGGNRTLKDMEEMRDELFSEAGMYESGRGIMLMKAIFDQILYNRQGNEILLIKRIANRN